LAIAVTADELTVSASDGKPGRSRRKRPLNSGREVLRVGRAAAVAEPQHFAAVANARTIAATIAATCPGYSRPRPIVRVGPRAVRRTSGAPSGRAHSRFDPEQLLPERNEFAVLGEDAHDHAR